MGQRAGSRMAELIVIAVGAEVSNDSCSSSGGAGLLVDGSSEIVVIDKTSASLAVVVPGAAAE